MSIAPIRRSILVKAAPARAFEAFTRDIGRWWPKQMMIGSSPFTDIVLEPHVGGRWFERAQDNVETNWGEVLAWEPPGRLLLAWRINANWAYDPDLLTEVELTFTPEGEGTRVMLEHRKLERFGDSAGRVVEQLSGGWPAPLQSFTDFINRIDTGEESVPHG